MLLITCIGACFLLQAILPSHTTKDNVFIYSIVACFVIGLSFNLPYIFNAHANQDSIMYNIGGAIGAAIVGGAVGYNLGVLFFRNKFRETEE